MAIHQIQDSMQRRASIQVAATLDQVPRESANGAAENSLPDRSAVLMPVAAATPASAVRCRDAFQETALIGKSLPGRHCSQPYTDRITYRPCNAACNGSPASRKTTI